MNDEKLYVKLPIDELQRMIGIDEGAAAGIGNTELSDAIFNAIDSIDMMIAKAKEDNCVCENCAYYNVFSGVCCNADSEHCADFVFHNDSCKHWLSAEEFESIRRECNGG